MYDPLEKIAAELQNNSLEKAPENTDQLLHQLLIILQAKKSEGQLLPDTAVFVDFENWCFALHNEHGRTPNIQAWFDDVKEHGNIVQTYFFGDLSEGGGLTRHLDQLRQFTQNIVDTRSTSEYKKKDTTDFAMCSHIYQTIMSFPTIKQIVLFTGDGDFSSILSYLKNYHNKKIGIYGINRAMSKKLVEVAHWYRELPLDREMQDECKIAILNSLLRCELRGKTARYYATVDNVAIHDNQDRKLIGDMINQLESELIIYFIKVRNQNSYATNKWSNIIKVRWDLIPDKYLVGIDKNDIEKARPRSIRENTTPV